ncbi:MAG: 30S ribosomal protein S1 [Bryobacteraceae bacterium]
MPESPSDLEPRAASAHEASFGEMLSEFEEARRQASAGQGESRKGTVIAVTSDGVFVDIGWKTEGLIPLEEFRDSSPQPEVKVGDQVVVSIRGRAEGGYYLLSKIKVERPKDWSALESAFAGKRTIAGVVTGVIKGGLSVDVGVRAFLPASRSGAKSPAEIEQLVGQEIACKIIELDVSKEDVVVDRRAVLEEEEATARQARAEALQEGQVVRATVRTLTDFGAFLDLGGIEGLLHVADISWARVSKPSDVLKAGDELEVQVLKVDHQARRISLGLKQMTPDPWTLVAETYPIGQRVRGKVTRVAEFGAFVELAPGIEGLIHLSDLSWSKKARKPSDVLKPGELAEVVVLSVSPAERRIGLGLKQALGDPWEEAAQKFPAGSVVEGKITNLAKFGAFVELAEGVEGMIHIGDISAEKRLNHPQDELKLGQVVKAQVLDVDREKRRIRLGIKQLQPTSVDEYIAEHKLGDLVTGRIVEVAKGTARVELGEGLLAACPLPKEPKKEEQAPPADNGPADVGALSALLAAKWKQGGLAPATGQRREPARAGQIRTFRITLLDPTAKRIELELAG